MSSERISCGMWKASRQEWSPVWALRLVTGPLDETTICNDGLSTHVLTLLATHCQTTRCCAAKTVLCGPGQDSWKISEKYEQIMPILSIHILFVDSIHMVDW